MIESIYLVTQESKVNGRTAYNVVPCISKETAKGVVTYIIVRLMSEDPYKTLIDWSDVFPLDEKETSWYIADDSDNNHERITIEEKAIQY